MQKDKHRLTIVLPIVGLDVGAIGYILLFGFGSDWRLSIWLLVIIFIKIFLIWLRLSGLEGFQFPHHRQYFFVACNSKMTEPSNFIIQVFRKDKTIKISTVSPNGKFFYKIKEPKDLYWGLFFSPIAFFDTEENLIYYDKAQYAQFDLTKTKEWEVVSWSSSGNFAFFIERNYTKSLQYVLLDLFNRTVSKTDFHDTDKDKWTTELFSKLPQDKAQEAYYKIISAPSSNEVLDYVLTLSLIDDKRALIKTLEQYYFSDFKKRLQQFEEGNFDETIIAGSEFDNFTSIVPDKLNKGILEVWGIDSWRP